MLLMNVAGEITNDGELMQLGLNLDVDENEVKRTIASKHGFIFISQVKGKDYLTLLFVTW